MANELAEMMKVPARWRVDGERFSQLGYLFLPESVSEDVYYKRDLTPEVKELSNKYLRILKN